MFANYLSVLLFFQILYKFKRIGYHIAHNGNKRPGSSIFIGVQNSILLLLYYLHGYITGFSFIDSLYQKFNYFISRTPPQILILSDDNFFKISCADSSYLRMSSSLRRPLR